MPRGSLEVEGGPALRWLAAAPASPRYLAVLLVLAGLYILCAKLGLRLALLNPSATAVWAPTGISFAAFLLLGPRAIPPVLIGAFISNLTTSGTLLTSAVIALGNTAEGLVGAALVRRFAGGPRVFDRAATIFRFVLLSALASTAVSATVGVGTLAVAGYARLPDLGEIWLTWWLGDAVGDVVAAPVIVLLLTSRGGRWTPARAIEAALLAAVLAAAGWGGFHLRGGELLSFTFLCIPPLLWAAFRFEPREAALAPLLLAVAAVAAATSLAASDRSLSGQDENSLLLQLQAFVGVAAVTTLAVASMASEQRALTGRLQRAAEDLQGKVDAAGEALAGTAAEARLTAGLLSRSEQLART
ncbi:MAG TPA: MASE1 domain-containing protein, partial [Spirochaetia bacterium]|nr:MASE1 domain-containing protein [Spirochaetia bacterium]